MPAKSSDLIHPQARASSSESAGLVSGLECRIGRAHLAVPVDWVGRLIEYRPAQLPLAKRWIGGVAIHEEAPVLSVALVPAKEPLARGTVTGILLNVPGSPIGWALEIHEVFVFVRARLQPRREPANSKLPRWIASAVTADDRQVAWLDVPAMLADLAQVGDGQP